MKTKHIVYILIIILFFGCSSVKNRNKIKKPLPKNETTKVVDDGKKESKNKNTVKIGRASCRERV